MRAIHSAGFNASLQLPIDHNRVQFCTSYHLSGHCNDNCMRRAWHRALTSTKTAQHNIFYDCMCPHLQFQNRGMVAQLAGKCTQWEINPIQGLSSTHTSNYLAAFSHKVCTWTITQSGKPCRLGNMETALRAIGQKIALLGPNHHDQRLQPNGKLIFALKWQFQSYKKEEPPPTHIEQLPLEHIKLAVQACHASNMEKDTCRADMITIGVFNVALVSTQWLWQWALQGIKHTILPRGQTSTHTVLWAFAHGGLSCPSFDTPKTGVKGKHIGHRCSTSTTLCPI